ncbi:hypothetical protein [Paenirhodobacter enshiensis]|uniref:hypothetical protein n=1 Tax=Paenirhodobacter enshiensis TaxID=1105367 RepID=UPI0035B0B6DF
MPELDLSRALRIGHMGHEVAQLSHLGQAIWTAAPAAPVIAIASGSGYAGSVYSSTVAGQWTADGVAIAGATGTAWTMTAAYEGKAIRCGASNAIRIWTPGVLASAIEYLDLRRADALTLAAGRVASVTNLIGGQARSQKTASAQPLYTAAGLNGLPAMTGSTALLSGDLDTGDRSVWAVALVLAVSPSNGRPLVELNKATPDSSTAGSFRPLHVYSNRITPYVAGSMLYAGNITDGVPIIVHSRIVIGADMSVGTTEIDDSTRPTPTSTLTERSTVTYFNRASGNTPSAGVSLAQVVIGTGELSVADQQRIEGFMAHSYGLSASLPAAHPYRTNAPRIA